MYLDLTPKGDVYCSTEAGHRMWHLFVSLMNSDVVVQIWQAVMV